MLSIFIFSVTPHARNIIVLHKYFSTASVFPTKHCAAKISLPVLPHHIRKNMREDFLTGPCTLTFPCTIAFQEVSLPLYAVHFYLQYKVVVHHKYFSNAYIFPTKHFVTKISSPLLPHRIRKNMRQDFLTCPRTLTFSCTNAFKEVSVPPCVPVHTLVFQFA